MKFENDWLIPAGVVPSPGFVYPLIKQVDSAFHVAVGIVPPFILC